MSGILSGMSGNEPLEWLREEIESVLVQWEKENGVLDYWRTPLVGIASADDPLFMELRKVVAEDHAMPGELLPEARSVVVFFLPFQPRLGRENDQTAPFATRSWAESYVTTNRVIGEVCSHLKNRLEEAGHTAAVTPATHNFDEKRLLSRWSHKHLGYIAGLGTFGHHHLLITEAGCCGRLGSLATSMSLPATPRPQVEYCLLKAGHRCQACMVKCKYDALKKTAFDRHACYEQLLRNNDFYSDLPLVDVCGKCACEVPCSYRIPKLGK